MPNTPSEDLSRLFEAMRQGELGAEERLYEFVYRELHKMAHGRMIRVRPGDTFQTTALVNEAYLRLAGSEGRKQFQDRQHFFRSAALAMRHILVDRARRAGSAKRGGGLVEIPFDEQIPSSDRSIDLIALDEALARLARQSPRLAEVVHYRFFLGMTVAETAKLLGVAPRTVDSDWLLAKTWLHREMSQDHSLPENASDGP